MSYVELEQFLDRGAIRAWWGLSWRTFFGCAAGAVLGQQVGAVVWGASTAGVALTTLLGAVLGLTLLLKQRGIIVAHRLLVLGTFGLRAMRGHTFLDGQHLYPRLDDGASPPVQVRVHAPHAPSGSSEPEQATGDGVATVLHDGGVP